MLRSAEGQAPPSSEALSAPSGDRPRSPPRRGAIPSMPECMLAVAFQFYSQHFEFPSSIEHSLKYSWREFPLPGPSPARLTPSAPQCGGAPRLRLTSHGPDAAPESGLAWQCLTGGCFFRDP